MNSMKLLRLMALVSLAACRSAALDSPVVHAGNAAVLSSSSTPPVQGSPATASAQVAHPKAGDASSAQAADEKRTVPVTPTPPVAKAKDPAAVEARRSKLDALRKEHNEAMSAYYDLLRNAKTEEEQRKIAAEHKAPDASQWTPRFWELVNEDPKDDVALDALTWLYEESASKPDADRALAILMKEQIQSPNLAPLCDRFAGGMPGPREFLERVLAENPSRDVRGHALYALAKTDLASALLAERIAKPGSDATELAGLKDYVGEERYAQLAKLDVVKARTDAEALLERVAAEYGDVKFRSSTLGQAAKTDLHEIRDLAVGKPAPEIEAEDIGGTPFKLSDYVGKVVLLDFWGNW